MFHSKSKLNVCKRRWCLNFWIIQIRQCVWGMNPQKNRILHVFQFYQNLHLNFRNNQPSLLFGGMPSSKPHQLLTLSNCVSLKEVVFVFFYILIIKHLIRVGAAFWKGKYRTSFYSLYGEPKCFKVNKQHTWMYFLPAQIVASLCALN